MPIFEDLAPHLPHEGPPVPRLLPGWPLTPDDVNRAVYNYARSASYAIAKYQAYWQGAIENYRASLLRRLP